MIITPYYAGLLAVLLVVLSARVISVRQGSGVGLGDGGDKLLQRRIRVQGNFCEYTPFCLVLMGFAELQGAPGWLVHLIGLPLLVGRVVHAVGVSRSPENLKFRVAGMGLTFTAIGIGALANLGVWRVFG